MLSLPLASFSLTASNVLAVLALGLAVFSLFRPAPPQNPNVFIAVAVILISAALLIAGN